MEKTIISACMNNADYRAIMNNADYPSIMESLNQLPAEYVRKVKIYAETLVECFKSKYGI